VGVTSTTTLLSAAAAADPSELNERFSRISVRPGKENTSLAANPRKVPVEQKPNVKLPNLETSKLSSESRREGIESPNRHLDLVLSSASHHGTALGGILQFRIMQPQVRQHSEQLSAVQPSKASSLTNDV
jgi:hypothetical protein